jgi:hypothetical protein
MKFISVKEKAEVELIPLADLHLGSENCNLRLIHQTIEYIKENPKARVVILGDVLETAIIGSKGNPYFAKSLEEEVKLAVDVLKPIKDKVLGVINGNHECVEAFKTEILTANGWKIANEITEKDKIAQFDMETGEISFSRPLKVSFYYVDKIVKVKTNQGEELVTLNHCLVVNGKRVRVDKLMQEGLNQKDQRFAGKYKHGKKVNLSPDQVRLITWLVTDGTWVSCSRGKKRLQWKLSKERKIKELTSLLEKLGIPYTFRLATKCGCNKLQPYLIRVYGKWARIIYRYLRGKKQFPEWFKYLNKEQLLALLETLAITDGNYSYNHIVWISTNKHNVDTIQLACIYNDIPCKYTLNKKRSGFKTGKPQYHVSIYPNGIHYKWASFEVIQGKFKVAAIAMPKQTLITRVSGRVNFTGNSRISKAIGLDILGLICRKLGIGDKYSPGFLVIRLSLPKTAWYIVLHHGYGGGRLKGGKINNLQRLGNLFPNADFILMGHTHDFIMTTDKKFIIDKKHNLIKEHTTYFINVPSFLNYGGYAEQYAYPLQSSGVVKITLPNVLNFYKNSIKIEPLFQ